MCCLDGMQIYQMVILLLGLVLLIIEMFTRVWRLRAD